MPTVRCLPTLHRADRAAVYLSRIVSSGDPSPSPDHAQSTTLWPIHHRDPPLVAGAARTTVASPHASYSHDGPAHAPPPPPHARCPVSGLSRTCFSSSPTRAAACPMGWLPLLAGECHRCSRLSLSCRGGAPQRGLGWSQDGRLMVPPLAAGSVGYGRRTGYPVGSRAAPSVDHPLLPS